MVVPHRSEMMALLIVDGHGHGSIEVVEIVERCWNADLNRTVLYGLICSYCICADDNVGI